MRKSEIRFAQDICKKLGWRLELTSKHPKLVHPEGAVITISGSPSCPHYRNHVMQDVRKLLKSKGEFDKLPLVK